MAAAQNGIDLYWLPLVPADIGSAERPDLGRIAARREGRPACDLYHSALVVYVPEGGS